MLFNRQRIIRCMRCNSVSALYKDTTNRRIDSAFDIFIYQSFFVRLLLDYTVPDCCILIV